MVRRSPTQREVRARRPASAAALLRTHPHQIIACPHTLPGLLSHSSQHRHSCKTQHPQSKQRCRGTELDRSIFALLCGERSTRTWRRAVNRRGNSWGSKTYLSTQRCPRVEVVGYPQHPQNGKTQQDPGFPPHGCRVGLIQPSVSFAVPL